MNKAFINKKYRKEIEERIENNKNSKFSKTQIEKLWSFNLKYDKDMYLWSQDFHIDKCLDIIEEIKNL